MITIFDHFGALKACRQLLTPILRPLIGVPGSAGLALIASLQSTDGGAALTRQLKTTMFLQIEKSITLLLSR